MKIFKTLLMIVLFPLLLGAFAVLWLNEQFIKPQNISPAVELVIPKGATLNKTVEILTKNEVVKQDWVVMLFARIYNLSDKIKAGEYYFSGAMSLKDVMDKITRGEVIQRVVTIPEGKSLFEIKKILENNPYLVGDITIDVQEGEIMPETYRFTKGESRNSIVKRAKDLMMKTLDEVFLKRSENTPVKTKEELLILASIIEKETGLSSERHKVASVFTNRLKLGMKLQTDPTVIYAVTNGTMQLNRPIYKRDLAYDSPYNTYVYKGLPPRAICSPGRAALEAAANPDSTPYLYFVADGVTGGHRFARTLSEHNENVAHYRKMMK